jgi:UDP-N-acetylmuramoyl-L-alanyl-D-glutamate--2,6-diaminopimelate ligase
MRLTELLEGGKPDVADKTALNGLEITGITCDSREVEPGFVFAALPGSRTDGRAFIDEAARRGAVAVLGPPGTEAATGEHALPLLIDENPRRRFALMAARYYGQQPSTVVAVTGTNGKTSVVSFTRQIWQGLGRAAASVGTLGVTAPDMAVSGSLTTPDPVALHRNLSNLAVRGVECLALEASSHGLAQYRLDGIDIEAAAFTNLSRDHLDYHGSFEAYLEAKMRLFSEVMDMDGIAVLNADSAPSAPVLSACKTRGVRAVTYGFRGGDVRIERAVPLPDGQRLRITVAGKTHTVTLPLVGAFQASNALCALGLAAVCGDDCDRVVATLETLEGAPGRVQRVATLANGAAGYVDYAHTPDALANILEALRPHALGRLHVVFGAGGDRDSGKRPEMGRIASELADHVIVTDDNPRTEDAAEIRRQVLSQCPGAREIGDRAEAIAAAVAGLGADDLLVVAGKGHETGQIVGTDILPFDDASVLAAAMGETDA